MTKLEIIRAWKDEEYLASLRESDRAFLPQDPAGLCELSDQDLRGVEGGTTTTGTTTTGTMTMSTAEPRPFAMSCLAICQTGLGSG